MQHFFSFILLSGGRKMILDSAEGVSGKYRSSALKKTYAFNEKGEFSNPLNTSVLNFS
jgi:hypothetical protein